MLAAAITLAAAMAMALALAAKVRKTAMRILRRRNQNTGAKALALILAAAKVLAKVLATTTAKMRKAAMHIPAYRPQATAAYQVPQQPLRHVSLAVGFLWNIPIRSTGALSTALARTATVTPATAIAHT